MRWSKAFNRILWLGTWAEHVLSREVDPQRASGDLPAARAPLRTAAIMTATTMSVITSKAASIAARYGCKNARMMPTIAVASSPALMGAFAVANVDTVDAALAAAEELCTMSELTAPSAISVYSAPAF